MQWYYFSHGKQVGPITEDQLFRAVRDGLLGSTDYVWNPSMGSEWVQAQTIPGLFAPPPIQPTVLAPPLAQEVVPERVEVVGPRSCGVCASLAWERMKEILFRPFNLGKWFALGFSAWLARLGEQGGGFNMGGGNWQETMAAESANDPAAFLAGLWDKAVAHAPLIISIVSVVLVLSVVIGLVFLWIRCRGKFMFLDNVVNDRMEITYPWRAFRERGNSLFMWSIVYTLVGLAVLAILVAVAAFSFLIPVLKTHSVDGLVSTLVANCVLWLIVAGVFLYIERFLEDFVIPIMYRQNLSATQAWSQFLRLLGDHTWSFIGYGLFYLMLYFLAGFCILAVIVMTCCIAGCLIVLPYVGMVVLLPMVVFFRCFSLEYLAQFGPEFQMRRAPVAVSSDQ